MEDRQYQIMKIITFWASDLMCEKCKCRNDKSKCNFKICKTQIEEYIKGNIK